MPVQSRPSERRIRRVVAPFALTATLFAAPTAASAADAPLRTIGVTPGGAVTATQ